MNISPGNYAEKGCKFKMKGILTAFFFLVCYFPFSLASDIIFADSLPVNQLITDQDTLQKNQLLYNGVIWKNEYHRMKGDQFLFSDMFIPASVTVNGKTFRNVRVKYDVFSDELLTPINRDEIIKLNKEMVDSFCLYFDNKAYRFINMREDSIKELKGYINILYSGNMSFFARYRKNLSTSATMEYDGEFFPVNSMFLYLNGNLFRFRNLRDFCKIAGLEKKRARSFLSAKRLKVSGNSPDSFIPLIKFSDTKEK